jgi:hypothetical protein
VVYLPANWHEHKLGSLKDGSSNEPGSSAEALCLDMAVNTRGGAGVVPILQINDLTLAIL